MTLCFTLTEMFVVTSVLVVFNALGLNGASLLAGGFILLSAFFLRDFRRRRDGLFASVPDFLFMAACLMNLWYVSASHPVERQYDYFNFYMHADWFIQNDFFLTSPLRYLGAVYFQPPLWGMIAALVTKFYMLCGWTEEAGFFGVRFLSFFFISAGAIIFWRLTALFKFTGGVRLGIFAFFLFFPIHTIAANLVNNDAMVYFLMICMIYVGLLWYQNGGWKEAVFLSMLLFLAGQVKFSGLMTVSFLAPLGVGMLLKAENKCSVDLWGQFFVIALGGILGFGWGIFLLYHGLPIVPPPQDVSYQDLSAVGLYRRVLDFSHFSLFLPFADVKLGGEANVWLALIKTSLFGEWLWADGLWAYLMYGLGSVFFIIAGLLFFSLIFYKILDDFMVNLAILLCCFAVLISWMLFFINYPYFCSSEFRYVMILLPFALIWVGNFLTQKSLPKAVYLALAGGEVVFIAAKFMLYLNTI